MLLFPIPCMGSELLDLKLIKCETQHVGYQFLMVILELECNIPLK